MVTYIFRDLNKYEESFICRYDGDADLPKTLSFQTVFPESWTDSNLLRTLSESNQYLKDWATGRSVKVQRINNAIFKVVRFDETSCWNTLSTVKTGRVWGYYLLDTSCEVFQCSMTPHYNAHFLYNEFERGHDLLDSSGNPLIDTDMVFSDGDNPWPTYPVNTKFDIVRDNIEIPEHADSMEEAEAFLHESYRCNPIYKQQN